RRHTILVSDWSSDVCSSDLGDYKLFDSILTRVRAVTAQEIQQAAAKYLTLANASIHEYESAKATPRSFTPEKFAELILTFESREIGRASCRERVQVEVAGV